MIEDLKEGVVNGLIAALKTKQLVPFQDQNRGKFLKLTFIDRSGELEGRIWDGAEGMAAELVEGRVYSLSGTVHVWQGRKQIVLQTFKMLSRGEYDMKDFIPPGEDLDGVKDTIMSRIERIGDKELRRLLHGFFRSDLARGFFEAPGSMTVHHAYLGGLAEHTLEVVRVAEAVTPAGLVVGGIAGVDLVVAGAILHDVGKLLAYSYDAAIRETDEGRLLGHSVLGYKMVAELMELLGGFDRELHLRIGHMVLSHHGQLEWGAPILPMTVEAAILHYADLTTSKVAQFKTASGGPTADGWTARARYLERALYVGERRE